MKYQFRALCTGSPIVLDNCGAGYEAPTPEDAWLLVMRAISLGHLDRSRYNLEPLGQGAADPAEVTT